MTYNFDIEFVETSVFTKQAEKLFDDASYRSLQQLLVEQPKSGIVIPGCGGLRKLRWKGSGRGKSGGLRIIYYFAQADHTCLLLYAYAINECEDLTRAQLNILAKLVVKEFK